MAKCYVREKCKYDGHAFYQGMTTVPDEIVQGMVDEGLCDPPIQLPPGTTLRGLWWTDENGEDHANWVAWVG